MISAIVLGAGLSTRMGSVNKLLMKIDNVPIIEIVIKNIVKSNINEIILVYRDNEVYEIGQRYGIKAIFNEQAYLGQSTSIIKGLEIINKCSDGYLFIPGDMPFIKSENIDMLINYFMNNKNNIVIPTYNGVNGSPVIFPSYLHEQFLKLEGDSGGKPVIINNQDIVSKLEIGDNSGYDIDTMEDYILAVGGLNE